MKIAILGLGRVGSAIALSVVMKGLANKLILAKRSLQHAEGEALDLSHATAFVSHQVDIQPAVMEDVAGADLIVLTPSIPMTSDITSRELLVEGNVALYRELIPRLAKQNPNAILLIVTNPVDVMTYVAWKLSGFPANRVIGSGTLIDSARYRFLLSRELKIHPDDIRAYILGEHGDRQFPAVSLSYAGGKRIDNVDVTKRLFDETVQSGYEIMKRVGHTKYGIAMAVSLIIEGIAKNDRRTMPVSTLIEGYCGVEDVCLSVPCVIGRRGVEQKIEPELSREEVTLFQQAAAAVQQMTENCGEIAP